MKQQRLITPLDLLHWESFIHEQNFLIFVIKMQSTCGTFAPMSDQEQFLLTMSKQYQASK